ncbi:Choline dehydrogenase, mitochondrial, partial [Orchesella cincta]
VSKIDVTTQDGWRESTYRSFYRDTGKPNNLCIKKYARVTKINFLTLLGPPKAVGVTYTRQCCTVTVTATKEVILSAGTFGSAQLLMISGVGPAEHLSSLNVRSSSRKQLSDHVTTLVGPFLKSPGVNPNRDLTIQAATEFLTSGTGLLAAPGTLTGQGFIKSPVAVISYPELPQDLNKMFGPRVDILESWFDPYHKQNVDARFGLLILGRPKSVGELRLASTNPYDNPIMDLQFSNIVDLYENTVALNTKLFEKPVPGCDQTLRVMITTDVLLDRSPSQFIIMWAPARWEKFFKYLINSFFQCRVMGIDGLRVIDASVMPRLPNGNTQAATIMIAEKGSDLIIADM